MRISSQNNQFIFNLPEDFISRELEEQFQLLMDKNLIPYVDVMAYVNSTIKDIVFPSLSYNTVEQTKFHGKKINWREAQNVMDKFQHEIDITFRSVDSHLNYFIILQILNEFYLGKKNYLDAVNVKVLDKDGDLIYTVIFKDVIYKSLSELRMAYYQTSFAESTFTLQFNYVWIDVVWELNENSPSDGKSIYDTSITEGDPRDITRLEKEYQKRFNQN